MRMTGIVRKTGFTRKTEFVTKNGIARTNIICYLIKFVFYFQLSSLFYK